jgi:cytochrome c oxidase assembly protein Cox11
MFDNNYTLTPFKDSIQTNLAAVSFSKNMLKASYITVPILFQFNTSKNHGKSFHFAVGGQVAIKLGSRSKQVYFADGDKKRDIYKSDYNLNPFQYGLTARVGYGKVNVFANYNLSEVFKSGKGPELYPFQIGVTLVPW